MRLVVRENGAMEPHAWAQFIAEVRVIRPEPGVVRFYLCFACKDLLEVAPGAVLIHECAKAGRRQPLPGTD